MLVLLRNKARDSGEAGSRALGEPGEAGLEAAPAAWRDVSGEPGLSAKLTDLHTFCGRRAAWGLGWVSELGVALAGTASVKVRVRVGSG